MATVAPTPSSDPRDVQGELRKWHKVTIVFQGQPFSETDARNPFMDFRLDVTFKHPATEKKYVIPGYFAADGDAANTGSSSGDMWHCHFAPDETGTWNYETSFYLWTERCRRG